MEKYERPPIKIITKQWVRENCKTITDRDMGLLNLIKDRRILRRDQIERLYPTFSSTNVLNRRLKFLFKKHIIDKYYPRVGLYKGSSQQYICLDRAGIILLDCMDYNKPIGIDREGNRRPFLGWEHRVMINEYECILRRCLQESGNKLLHYFREDPIMYADTKIIPDIACLMKVGSKGYSCIIEVDLGTEDLPYLRKKIDSYVEFYMSKRWVTHQICKVFKTPTFPKILFFTENTRSQRIRKLVEYTQESSIQFKFYTHEQATSVFREIIKTGT